jgi:hypothetical protein
MVIYYLIVLLDKRGEIVVPRSNLVLRDVIPIFFAETDETLDV